MIYKALILSDLHCLHLLLHITVIVIFHDQNPQVLNYSENYGSYVFLKWPFKVNVKSRKGKFRYLVTLNTQN